MGVLMFAVDCPPKENLNSKVMEAIYTDSDHWDNSGDRYFQNQGGL